MSRPGVTYQAVAEAATQLMSQGRNPTIEQIRIMLGTGSSTTLANHLKIWKEKQNGSSLLVGRENIPEELVSMLQGLWQRVIDHSEEKMANVSAQWEQQLQQNMQELEKYKHNNQRWQHLFNQWTKEKEYLQQEKSALDERVQAYQNEKAGMQSKLDGQRQQLQEKQDRINELFRLHKQAQANLEYDRETVKQERLEEHRQFEQQRIMFQESIHTLQEKFLLLQKQMDTLQQKNDLAEKKYSQLVADFTEQSAHLLSTEDALQQKIRETEMLKQQLDNAAALNKQFEVEKWNLVHDKARLEGQLKERVTLTEKDLVLE